MTRDVKALLDFVQCLHSEKAFFACMCGKTIYQRGVYFEASEIHFCSSRTDNLHRKTVQGPCFFLTHF